MSAPDDETGSEPRLRAAVAEHWPAPAPPGDFVDRVMAARSTPAVARARRRWPRVVASGAAAAVLVAGGVLIGRGIGREATGAVTATARTTLEIGGRARAVVEPGTGLSFSVARDGATRVRQAGGNVFYRVDRAAASFVVEAGAAEVRVTGTCFRVAEAGGVLAVSVDEGAVEVVNRHGAIAVAAGEGAVVRAGIAPERQALGELAVLGASGAVVKEEEPAPEGEELGAVIDRQAAAPRAGERAGRGERATRAGTRAPERAGAARDRRAQPSKIGALASASPSGEPGGRPAPDAGPPPAWLRTPPALTPPAVAPPRETATITFTALDREALVPRAASALDPVRGVEHLGLQGYARAVHARLAPLWRPVPVFREAFAHQTGASRAEVGSGRTTVLRVRVAGSGAIAGVELDQPSGVAALDAEARAVLERMAPLPAPPTELLDRYGELGLRLAFHLDLSVTDFTTRLGREVRQRWHPALPFMRFASPGRASIVRVAIEPGGEVMEAAVVQSSGVDHLDEAAVRTVAPGTRLPPPPPALRRGEGPAILRLVFVPDPTGAGHVRAEPAER